MVWEEINMQSKTWTIPASRMKSGGEHRVPLNDECIDILNFMNRIKSKNNAPVFLQKLSDVAISKTLKSVSYPEATIHGLRSSFRDWCSEKTNFSSEVFEAALAHTIKDKTVAAYSRTDFFEKRIDLMTKWGKYLTGNKI